MRNTLLVILLVITCIANGQNKLQGMLTDSEGVGIAYATVSLSADSLNLDMLDYTITDDNGHWSIDKASANGRYLTFACLGYTSKTIHVAQSSDVQLQYNHSDIDEIVVRSRRLGIQAKQDTLVYSPEQFKTGEETNLGDVINKLPGMQVNDGGKISFNGKDINKILVNGKDILLSSGSAALSTLSADFANSVELLQNYTTNNITQSFDSGNTLALDIKTDKGNVNGALSLGGGAKKKGEIKASIFNISNGISESIIVNANNTGEPVFSIIDYIHSFGKIKKHGSGVQTVGINDEFSQILMPSENMYKSANGIVNTNIDISKTDTYKAQLMLLGNMYNDKASESQSIMYVDLGSHSTSSVDESRNNRFLTALLNQEWNTSVTHNVTSSTIFRSNRSHNNTEACISTLSVTDSLYQREKVSSIYFQESLTSNKLINSGLLTSHVDFNLERNYDCMTLSGNNSKEDIKTDVLAEVSYKHPVFSNSVFLYGIISIDNNFERYAVTENERMRNNSYACHIGILRNKGIMQFDAGLQFRSIHSRYQLIGGTLNYNACHIEPKASFKLKFSNQHELNISYQSNNGLVEMSKISRTHWNKKYDRIMSPSVVNEVGKIKQSLSFNYFLMNLYSRTTFLCIADLTDMKDATTDSHTKDSKTTTHYVDGGHKKTAFIRTSITQGLPIPIDIKAIGELSRYSNIAYTNSLRNELNGHNADWTLGITSRLSKSMVNVELSIRKSVDGNKMKLANISTHNSSTDAEAKLLFKCGGLKGYAGYAYRSVNNGGKNTLHDISFLCSYKIRSTDIQLVSKNLLHLDSHSWRSESVSEARCSNSEYRRMPGYVMLRITKSIAH